MKLSEITTQDDRSVFMGKYAGIFDGKPRSPIKSPKLPGMTWSRSDNNDSEYYGAFDGDRLVGVLEINQDQNNHPQITDTATDPEYQNRGILRYLLNMALDKYGDIWSDHNHSEKAKGFWQRMIEIPGPYNNIDAIRPSTGETFRVTRDNFNDVWNERPEPVLRIHRLTRTVAEQAYHERTREWRRARGRTKAEMYYGPFNDPQVNP